MKQTPTMMQSVVVIAILTTATLITPAARSSRITVPQLVNPRISVCTKKLASIWERLPDQRRLVAYEIVRTTQLGSFPTKALLLTLSYLTQLPLTFEFSCKGASLPGKKSEVNESKKSHLSGVTPGVTDKTTYLLVDWHAGPIRNTPRQHFLINIMQEGNILTPCVMKPLASDICLKPGRLTCKNVSVRGHWDEQTDRPSWDAQKSLAIQITHKGKKIQWSVCNKRQHVAASVLLYAMLHPLNDQTFAQLKTEVEARIQQDVHEEIMRAQE